MDKFDTEYILVIFDNWSYVFFGLLVSIYLVIFSVIWFSICSVLWIRSNGPARVTLAAQPTNLYHSWTEYHAQLFSK